MTTAPTPAVVSAETTTGSSDDLNHIYCPCDPDIALCGTDISDYAFAEDDETDCVVCTDLEDADAPCARCGRYPC